MLPFGLNVAPNSFARMMSLAFIGLDPSTAFMYLDDIIIIGVSENHHLNNLRLVFETCRNKNLKLNPSKCEFFKPEVTFHGHKCTCKGILPDNAKFSSIQEYPLPKNADEVKRFVCFCNYYRKCIPNFGVIASPLNFLTKKKSKFIGQPNVKVHSNHLKNH